MPVSALYVGLIGILMMVLSIRVIRNRQTEGQSLGHGGSAVLERRIRAQANLAEYAPLGLIALFVLEFNGTPAVLLHGLGALLVAGRVLHGWALSFTDGSTIGRTGGMALTLTMLGLSSLACLRLVFAGGVPAS